MTVTCRLIAEGVCRTYGVGLSDLYSRRRSVATPRNLGWTLARHLTSRSLPQIGRMMGGFDHTSVLYGIRKIEAAIETDTTLAAHFNNLADALLTVGRAHTGGDQPVVRFQDLDPTETAYLILNSPFGNLAPSLDEIRALAMGVLHYEAELIQARSAAPPADPEIRYVLARRSADNELKSAGRAVVRSWENLQNATFAGTGAINARRAFIDALKTLQTTIERT